MLSTSMYAEIDESEVDDTSPSAMVVQQQGPASGFGKRHVSGMLRFLEGEEQRAKALKTAAAYKKMFAEKHWESVLASIQCFVEEDHLRDSSSPSPAQITAAGLPKLKTSVSASPIGMVDSTLSNELSRHSTSSIFPSRRGRAPSTPRERWDVLHRGGILTPLSPTPTGNAFADGGFWEQLTPKTPASQTPVTAIPTSPFSPVVPESIEARMAYDQVKGEVDAMARSICANRMGVHSTIRNSADIPKTLIKPKDQLKGAEITMQYRQVALSTVINPELPKKLKSHADEEAKIFDQYAIKDTLELLDLDTWLQIDEPTLSFTTILDAQRELLHMHRNRRKSKDLKISDRAIQQAWATRILEDAERAVEIDCDTSSTHSDETKGYEYSNFLRSIKREVSSSSDIASILAGHASTDVATQRSSGTNTASLPLSLSQETTLTSSSYGSSTSPKKHSSLPFRRSARTSVSHGPSPEKRSSTSGLRLSTTRNMGNGEIDGPVQQLSPQDRAFRRMGASHVELSAWAQQLRDMEMEQRVNKERVMALYVGVHPALRTGSAEGSGEGEGVLGQGDKNEDTVFGASREVDQGKVDDWKLPPAPPGFKYVVPGTESLYDSVRRKQHVRSRSSVACASGEDNWSRELKRMESAERVRQLEELGKRRSE
jgi:hypothetical protein